VVGSSIVEAVRLSDWFCRRRDGDGLFCRLAVPNEYVAELLTEVTIDGTDVVDLAVGDADEARLTSLTISPCPGPSLGLRRSEISTFDDG
jgi:hypothetical protein